MAIEDLADQVDDYICTFEGLGDIVMDSLAMFIFIWSLCVLFLIWLGKFLYQKYVKKASGSPVADTATSTLVKQASAVAGLPIRKSEPRDIGITKTVSPLGGASKPMRADTPLGGPQMRKRLSRKSPGPELRSRSKSRNTLMPQHVLGQDPQATQWATKTFRWLYSDLTIVNEVLHVWVAAVNDFIRNDIKRDDAPTIEVVRVLPESPAPNLSNIYCEPGEKANEVMLSIDCEANPVLQAKAIYDLNGRAEVSHYKITVGRLRARFSANMNFIALKGTMRIEGYPDIKLIINPVGAIKTSKEEANVQTALNEMLTYALRETVYPLDFSLYSTCPRGMDIEPSYDSYSMTTSEEDFNLYRATRSPTVASQTTSTRRLLVKVTRGEGLKFAKESYCVIEMDEPPQKNQTNTKPGENPHWDEHFLFNLNQNSAEILFEVYDAPLRPDGPPKFLGLGLVGIDELSLGLASTQILVLQPRPYETEEVFGSVTVEFVFIEGAPIEVRRQEMMPTRPTRLQNPGLSPSAQAFNDSTLRTTNISPIAKPSPSQTSQNRLSYDDRNTSIVVNGVHEAPPIAPLRESQLHHPVQHQASNKTLHPKSASPSPYYNGSHNSNTSNSPSALLSNFSNNNNIINGDNSTSNKLTTANEDERGRSNGKRNFFGNIKRRLARSKSRSKSKDRDIFDRSASSDRNGSSPNPSQNSTLQSTLSRRSSVSESSAVSGWSSASAKTYVHEASTLVLETIENGVKRHFLVPLAIAQKPRWRRKGTKLHIYNDHTFIAKHISGGNTCDVCNRSIMRRPGKQGYECRDCNMKCHKPCHVKAANVCPTSTILTVQLYKFGDNEIDRYCRKI